MKYISITIMMICWIPMLLISQAGWHLHTAPGMPNTLTPLEQVEVRSDWLEERLDSLLLPMMRKHDIDMWIVVNEEFNSDPVTEHIAPAIPFVSRRDIFILADNGQSLDRFAIARYEEARLRRFYEIVSPGGNLPKTILDIVEKYDPQTIGVNMGEHRGHQNGLTHVSYAYLSRILGETYSSRLVPAADLITDYLATRLPEELEYYRTAVLITDILVRRAFSNEVIIPGVTTVGDVRWWLMDQVDDLGLDVWFLPDLRVQRQAEDTPSWGRFVRVTPEDVVIRRGDLIHVDFGVIYLGFHTDWQKHAYLLKDGETEAPAGLQAALKNSNLLQDAVCGHARPGRTGPEVYDLAMKDMEAAGIEAMIYSHAIGTHGHGLGPGIDFRRSNAAGGARPLQLGTYMSIELNTSTVIPEWNGQKVAIMLEDDAYLTEEGYKFFRPRQTELYLIR